VVETARLLKFASALDVALIARQVQGQIGAYDLEVCPDDGKITIVMSVIKPLKEINCTLKVGSSLETDHSG